MSLLEVSGLKKMYGPFTVFDDVSFSVASKDRIGIVGRNGCGKTTLMNVIAGCEEEDGGFIKLASGCSIGYLEQNASYNSANTLYQEMLLAYGHVFAMEKRLKELEKLMNDDRITEFPQELDKVMREYSKVSEEFERKGGYNYDYKIKTVLFGLGFVEEDLEKIVKNFSGGQKVRVTLAKLLVTEPDLVLLDEPTNHLDLKAVQWLEGYLKSLGGSFMVVSHDRYFLDAVCDRIFHIDNASFKEYRGNYTFFTQIQEFNRQRNELEFEKQQELIAKYEEYIRRYKAGNRSTMAKSREKMLAKMKRIEKPQESSKVNLKFAKSTKSARKAVIIDRISKKFGDKKLFDSFNLVIERGERVGIVGPNGSGKTTFLKIITDQIFPDSGSVIYGENIKVGGFSQDLGGLNDDGSILDEVYRIKNWTLQEARNYLARFMFKGDDVFKQVKMLSGGERNRLVLAKLMLDAPNLLVLDEPTNHLDIDSRQALENAISEFDGTVITASHDRYFLDQIATCILEIADGQAKIYDGNYSYYKEKKAQERLLETTNESLTSVQKNNTNSSNSSTENGKSENGNHIKPKGKNVRQNKAKFDLQIKNIEEEIHTCEKRLEEVVVLIADPNLYADPVKSREVIEEHDSLNLKINELYLKWDEVCSQRENLD